MSQPVPASSPPAPPPASSPPPRRQRTLVRDAVEVLIIAFVLYIVISVAFQTVRVDGTSMLPTLKNDDFLIASRISYRLHDPERGDIVVLQPPTDPTKDFIKRVIAIPGDNIKIAPPGTNNHNPETELMLQPGGTGPWEIVHETYLNERWTAYDDCCAVQQSGPQLYLPDGSPPQALHIPTNEYFVMGDNRNHSEDSRLIGLIPRDKILAKAFVRVLPINTFGGFGTSATLVPQLLFPVPFVMTRRRRRALREALDAARGGATS